MSSQITLKAKGLSTSPNQLETQDGSLNLASNVIIKRNNVIESRRGYKLYGTQSASLSKQLFVYKNRLLKHFADTLSFDSQVLNANNESIFSNFSGTYSEVDPGLRLKAIESNGNFYFTSAAGIGKISATSGSEFSTSANYIVNAGGVKAINGSARIDLELGNETGILPADSTVAYRAVWGYKDINTNLILGTPSERIVLYDSFLQFLIPDFDRLLGALDDITTTTTTAFIGAAGAITAASAGAPSTITTTTHTLRVGDIVFITGTGIATLDGINHSVTAITATTFTVAASGGGGSATGSWYFSYEHNYVLPEITTSTGLQSQIIALASRIDADILYANDAGTAPLNVDAAGVSITGGIASVHFTAGLVADYFSAGSKIFLTGFTPATTGTLDGAQTVSSVDVAGNKITFATTATGAVTVAATANITSYEYRNAIANVTYNGVTYNLNTEAISNPATNTQLNILESAIEAILVQLQSEPATVISTVNRDAYITPIFLTTSTNVILTINIPTGITSSYFVQIYRGNTSQATGTTLLSDLVPDDEMKLVYEAFPSASELSLGKMTILDNVLDDFKGANLYTNPATGEGINQANDVPPVAKDINRFKNVLFYANTKTRQRLLLNLSGVTNFNAGNITGITNAANAVITTDAPTVDSNGNAIANPTGLIVGDIVYLNGTGLGPLDTKTHRVTAVSGVTFTIQTNSGATSTVGYWSNSMVAFVTSSGTQQYYFIKGVAEARTFTAGTKVNTNEGVLGANYFTIYSGNDNTSYYVWYKKTGAAVDPAIAGSTGIMVDISAAAIVTAADVANKTRDTLSRYPYDFSISGTTTQIIVTNTASGPATNSITSTLGTGWSVTTGTQGRGETAANKEVLLSTSASPAQALDETSRSLLNVVNLNASEQVYLYYLSGLSDVPGKFLIEGRGLSSPQFWAIANNGTTGDSFDPSISPSPDATLTNSLANPSVVTLASHGLVSGDTAIIAFSNSTPSINGPQLVTYGSASTFSVPVNVTVAGTTGVLIKSTLGVFSDNEQKKNRIYYSKYQQPEAVPLLNYFDVGSEEKAILRIFPLRDSLFVFKEDGLFRVSGEGAPFNLALFDSSCIMIAPDSLGVANNLLYAWTTQGIHTVSESGVDIISRDIDIDILQLASSNYPDFSTLTWGVGYDSDNSYVVYTNSETTDTVATLAYRFSNLTNSWTTFDLSTTCGIINPTDDKMYMGAGDVNYISQERKTFSRLDYADRELTSTLDTGNYSNGGATIKLPSTVGIEEGDVLYQEQFVSVYNFNNLLQNIDADTGIATVSITSISTGSTPTITVKNFTFATTDVNTGTDTITVTAHGFASGEKVRFTSTGTLPAPLSANTDYWISSATANTFKLATILNGTAIDLTSTGAGTHRVFKYHNLVAGNIVTLEITNSDPFINGTYSVVSAPNGYQFTINTSAAVTTAGTSGDAWLNYTTTLVMSGGDDPKAKLIALAAKLDTDPRLEFANYSSIIASQSGTIISNSAANPTVISLKTKDFVPADVNTGTDTITIVAHGYTNGQEVTFVSSGTLPGGLVAGTSYYIRSSAANTFKLSLSPNTAPIVFIDLTSTGAGTHTIRLSHQLKTGRYVTIAGTNSLPVIDGSYVISIVSAYQFSVPVSVTISGTAGTYSTSTSNFNDIKSCYNAITTNLNTDPGANLTSYATIVNTQNFEALITSVNAFTGEITLAPAIDFVVGALTIFKAIETVFQYAPQTMGDPLNWKHLSRFTMMFENKAFTEATMSFGSDLLPELIEVPFTGDGNGIFGIGNDFGSGYFGGGSNSAPFPTYFPRQVMRCRYVVIKWRHRIAREQYGIFGITIDGSTGQSPRAYR